MTNKLILVLFLTLTIQPVFSIAKLHQFASICPRSDEYAVSINNESAFVYQTDAGSFVSFEADEKVEVVINFSGKVGSAVVKPLRYNIEPVVTGNEIRFKMPAEAKLLVEINDPWTDGNKLLFLFSNPLETAVPDANDPKVKFFKGGQVYDVGEMIIENDESIYIEGGAVVRGKILAEHAKNITIGGYGVLDNGYYEGSGKRPRTILTTDCNDVNISDVVMINPQGWTLMLYYTGNVNIDNIKQITAGHGSDGIDIVSSRDVTIKNCFLSCGDDCIAIKAAFSERYAKPKNNTWQGTQDVLVEATSLHGFGAQAFEIGHELRQDPIKNIVHRNCDVLAAHGQGGVFGIRNCESATVSNVVYEDIRVDHYYNKLVDIRVIKSRYSRQEERGHIENVTFKNIQVKANQYNPGYSISLIGGYDENHKVQEVTFDNFRINGKKVTNGDELDLFVKQAEGIRFK